MDKLTSKKALLDSIRLSVGSDFKYNEKAILKEYQTQQENKSNLAIKILSILGGFLATLAFLGFLAIAGLYNSETGLLLFGIGFIISAIFLNKLYDKLIIDTFSISIYVIGFALLAFGLAEININENLITLLISLIAISSFIISQNFISSFISVLIVNGCFLFLIIFNGFYNLIHLYITICTLLLTYLFLNEAKIISSNEAVSKLYNPVRTGLVISLLASLISIGIRDLIPVTQNYIWLSSIVMMVVIIFLVSLVLDISKINTVKSKVIIYTFSVLILALTTFSPSISGAIVILLLSFLVNYRTGIYIGIIAIVYFISQYYYDLNFTLLTKSIILFTTGIVFLLFYLFTSKNINTNEKV